jgi:hypothetical protein
MTVVAAAPLSQHEAERLTQRIALRLDSIADNYVAVMPLIREAIERNAYSALGYRSPGEYVSDRFGGSLSRLGVEVRREVVKELTAAGMSTRAIAPVVGVNNATVHRDLAHVADATPEPDYVTDEADLIVDRHTGEILDDPSDDTTGGDVTSATGPATPDAEATTEGERVELADQPAPTAAAPRPSVVGLDGKTYTRPEPARTKAPPRRALTDQFFDAVYDLIKVAERVDRLAADDRFTQNAEKVAAKHRADLLRSIDLLQQVADRLA